MLFHKTPYAANFSYPDKFDSKTGIVTIGKRRLQAKISAFADDIYHLQLSAEGIWTEDHNLVAMNAPGEPMSQLTVIPSGLTNATCEVGAGPKPPGGVKGTGGMMPGPGPPTPGPGSASIWAGGRLFLCVNLLSGGMNDVWSLNSP